MTTDIATGAYVDYAWDYRNRLTSVTFRTSLGVKTKQVNYVYDSQDRLIEKRVDEDSDSDWIERYVYDGSQLALVLDGNGDVIDRLFSAVTGRIRTSHSWAKLTQTGLGMSSSTGPLRLASGFCRGACARGRGFKSRPPH